MPSFDVVSRLESQEIDNAIANSMKEIGQRYDFKRVCFSSNLFIFYSGEHHCGGCNQQSLPFSGDLKNCS